MKILKLFLLIGSSLLITSCDEDHIDYIDTHKICVVNNTLSTIKIYTDTIYLSVLPNDSIESDFDFGDSFFWGNKSGFVIADSTIQLPYSVVYMELQDYFTEEEIGKHQYINTFIIDDEWLYKLWRHINTND